MSSIPLISKIQDPKSFPISNLVPNHVGLIMDGNRRWAKDHGKTANQGHDKGSDVFDIIASELFDKKVKYVSAYLFSRENWKRKASEVDFLMRLIVKILESRLENYNDKGIKIRVIGTREGLKNFVIKAINKAEERTKNNTRGTLLLCINYSGKQEIADACKKIIDSGTKSENVTEELITENIYAADSEIPDIDIVVRSSGEQRLSGFMLWRASYAEMMFVDKHWPDFNIEDVDNIIKEYSKRQRRFGC
jgi:undecaprenyl diphosphate synthase